MIFFDIDRTLIDQSGADTAAGSALLRAYRDSLGMRYSVRRFCRTWNFLRQKHGRAFFAGLISSEEQRRRRVRELFARAGLLLSESETDDCLAIYQQHYCTHWKLFDDVLPCLRALSKNRIGIISNGTVEQQKRKLAQTGIDVFFEVTVVSEEIGRAKPHPEIFRTACRMAGCDPRDSIYIGDRLHHDALASRAAGMHGVWLDRHRSHRPTEVPVISSLTDVCSPHFLSSKRRPTGGLSRQAMDL